MQTSPNMTAPFLGKTSENQFFELLVDQNEQNETHEYMQCYTFQILTGLLFGFCSGYALYCTFKFIAFFLGSFFIFTQILQYYGFITTNCAKIQERLYQLSDINKDGKVNINDLYDLKNRLIKILSHGFPSIASFSTGFMLGIKNIF